MCASEAAWLPRLFDAAPVVVVAFDSTGRVLGMNAEAGRWLSTGSSEVAGLSIAKLEVALPGEVRAAFRKILSGESESVDGETDIDGQPACYRVGWTHRSAEEGLFVLVKPHPAQDGSDSEDFLSAASHQLKTHLTAIKGGAQLLERRFARSPTPLGEREQQLFDMVTDQVNRLTEIIDNLLETSRISGGRLELSPQTQDLRDVMSEAVWAYLDAAQDKPIALKLPSEPVIVRADHNRVVQVLHLLLRNAAVYSGPAAPVTVSLSTTENGDAQIAVEDSGAGIAPEDQPHVFERFHKGVESEQGLGLGLYIASSLVKLHGGCMWMRSQPGHGTTFYFSLPTG